MEPRPLAAQLDVPSPAATDGALGPGALVGGKYRIERALGRGGMGEVFLAFHEQLGRRVAIKVLQAEAATDPGVRARFRREAVAASTLASAHIAEVSDVGEIPASVGSPASRPYMVMEYLQGRDLSAHLAERGTLGVAECVDLLSQLCEGVRVAHAAGIVHRDLKPANLFLVPRADGAVLLKILDFGIAKAERSLAARDSVEPAQRAVAVGMTQLTGYGGMLGSARYMAPEQMESARDVDGRADIWSIGVIGYKLLTGRVPFEAESPEALFVAMITRPFVPLRGLRPDAPSALVEAVEVCLRPNRDDRWPTIEALAASLAFARAALTSDHLRLGGATPGELARSVSRAPTDVLPAVPAPVFLPAGPASGPVVSGRAAALFLAAITLLSVLAVTALAMAWGFVGPRRSAWVAAAGSPANAPPATPTYELTDTVVDPLALLPRAQAEAARQSPGAPMALQEVRVHDAGEGPVKLSGSTVVYFLLVRPGDPKAVDVSFLASGVFASTTELPEAARPITPPRCSFERARATAVAAGYVPREKSFAVYGSTLPNVWRFHTLERKAKTPFFDVDGVTCASVVPQRPRDPFSWR